MRSLIATRRVFSCGYFNASTRSFALVPFKLADIGEGIAEVELMKWFVKVFPNLKEFVVLSPIIFFHSPVIRFDPLIEYAKCRATRLPSKLLAGMMVS
jgi:hypothetical protein